LASPHEGVWNGAKGGWTQLSNSKRKGKEKSEDCAVVTQFATKNQPFGTDREYHFTRMTEGKIPAKPLQKPEF